MPQWRRIAQSNDIAENEPLVVTLDEDESVLLSRVDGHVTACGNTCPHYGGPLGDGVLRDGRVICPYHNATFSMGNGRLDRTPAMDDLPVYEVKEEDGAIFLGARHDPDISMPPGEDGRRILIVGGGAAGSACAEALRREGFSGRITMLTADDEPPYDRPMLSKGLLSGDAPAKYLPLRPPSFYDALHITTVSGTRVERLLPDERRVETSDGRTVDADMILLATGGVPRRLGIPGSNLEHVYTLRTHADASSIMARAEHASTAVVMGASFIGMEVAAQLRQRGLEVDVVEPLAQPMMAALGVDVGAWLRTVHEEQGVRFHLGRTASAVTASGDRLSIRLDDDATLQADLVVMGVGVEPRVDYLDGTGLVGGDTSRGVRVDEHLQTSAAGIYAAGDIAVYPVRDREYRVEHWVHAQAQGRHVARAMLGAADPFGRVPFFWTRQFSTSVKYAGFPEEFDHVQYDGVPGDGEFAAGYFVGERLVGVCAMGKAAKFARIAELLEEGNALSRDDFLGVRDTPHD